ncbi:signal recognition particle sec65 subunit [Coniochaeta sp. 2T2.1]|nr:signal recognition particle sec65 subunit [Coniochaeta sp. 2T2.1]
MSHPRIEEVSDSDDVDMSDPSEGDIDDFADEDIMRRVAPGTSKISSIGAPSTGTGGRQGGAAARAAQHQHQHILPPANLPSPQVQRQQAGQAGPPPPAYQTAQSLAVYAGYQILYPVYFDASRSRAEGRRVSKSLAVANPLAVEIASACQKLRLNPVLEPTKLHPKDWANPGRVRVLLKEQKNKPTGGQPVPIGAQSVNNKHHLYTLVAQHLKANPTTEKSSSLWWRLPGHGQGGLAAPDPSKPWPKPAVPRGWKIGELVPYWSPAVTGGGVSENLFKDMMKEMQGGGGAGGAGGMPDMASLLAGAGGGGGGGGGGQEVAKKKDKKGKGKK